MRKWFTGILILSLLSLLSAQTVTAPLSGDGSESDPYLIASFENLCWIAADTANWDKHYVQTADIDASATASWYPDGNGNFAGWIPIGNADRPFSGSYRGDGFSITGIHIYRNSENNLGLFGYVSAARIRDLGLIALNITGFKYTGGLAGQVLAESGIYNCHSNGSVHGLSDHSGGLMGYVNASTVMHCGANVLVQGTYYVGGLVGYIANSQLVSCSSFSAVTGSNIYIGGLAGYSDKTTVSNSYARGAVIGNSNTGGLLGYAGQSLLLNSYSSGAVSGGGTYVGGFAGRNFGSNVYSCFWDTESSGWTTSDAGTGKTTADMKTQSTFLAAGWSFIHMWDIDGVTNNGYPFLRHLQDAPTALAPESGNGSADAPFQIAGLENLYWLSRNPEVWNNHFIQTADIDARHIAALPEGWSPVGNATTKFTGSYDGCDHTIEHLYISRPNSDNIGLFGWMDGATINRLGLSNAQIDGRIYVAALAGRAAASVISNCYSSGSVFARYLSSAYAGGLSGWLGSSSLMIHSYSHASVSGHSYVGGLTGALVSSSMMSRSYSTGAVSGLSSYVGGLMGRNDYCIVDNSFWDTERSGQTSSDAGTGLSSSEMQDPDTYGDAGWNFYHIWEIDGTNNEGYPFLKAYPLRPEAEIPLYGSGSESDPYHIANLGNLYWLSQDPGVWNKHFIQTADIDAAMLAAFSGGGSPIGTSSHCFTGSYDGKGHRITHLYIDRPNAFYTGLFGCVQNALLRDLHLRDASVRGRNYCGGLAGSFRDSEISGCSVSGNVSGIGDYIGGLLGYLDRSTVSNSSGSAAVSTGGSYAGGLIGYTYYSTVSRCFSEGRVSGLNSVGGLLGYNYYFTVINDCYSSGLVSGSGNAAGGLIGTQSSGAINRCYSIGTVEANEHAGGLIGSLTGGAVNHSFWDMQRSGLAVSAAGSGKSTAEIKTPSTFIDVGWDFTQTWAMSDDFNDHDPFLRWQYYIEPKAATQSVTDIGTESARIHGTVIETGRPLPTQHGFCWNTTGMPTTDDDLIAMGSIDSCGDFSYEITALTPNTRYHVRAFVSNEAGTAYGETREFMTLGLPEVQSISVTDITLYTAILHAELVVTGNPAPSAHGFCRNTTGDPDIRDHVTDLGMRDSTGAFTVQIDSLQPNGIYYIRPFATNTVGTVYGETMKCRTLGPPVLGGISVADIGLSTVTANSGMTLTGNPLPSAHGFCWNTAGDPRIGDAHTDLGAVDSTGIFSAIITDLLSNTQYHLRAYAINTVDTVYGETIPFTTLGNALFTDIAVNDIGLNHAFASAALIDPGNPTPEEHGFCWGTNMDSLIHSLALGARDSAGTVAAEITGLLPNTMYYLRAYASNENGTVSSDSLPFMTLGAPCITTLPLAGIGPDSALAYGEIILPGNPPATAHGFCWNTAGDPRIGDDHTDLGTVDSTGVFTAVIPDLVSNTLYYLRAWAINAVDTVYGETIPFTTLETAIAEGLPSSYILSQNYPNPFNPTTTLQYGLPEASDVDLMIFDITGRKIKSWHVNNQQAGWHKIIWNGTNQSGQHVSTGVYIYSLRASDPSAGSGQVFVDTRKMVFMK